ncbi:MAG: hypothetical protein R3Y58_14460 [Eubacteriales bacterium]
MSYDAVMSSGVTENTPDNILLGAGTIHKGLVYSSTAKAWNFTETLVGATSGGNKFSIVPNILQVEVDGALVRTKGLDAKTGEVAKLETNLVETTPEIINASIIGQLGESDVTGYSVIESKESIDDADYWPNIAFVGKTITGKPIIVIMDNAICTSGLELEGKNKESGAGKYTFECAQELTGNLAVLPYHIYYPADESESESDSVSNE